MIGTFERSSRVFVFPNSQSHSGVNFFDMIRIWVISLEIEN